MIVTGFRARSMQGAWRLGVKRAVLKSYRDTASTCLRVRRILALSDIVISLLQRRLLQCQLTTQFGV